ncbi:MAG: phosphohistidine phosphatase SixA [Cyanobacteria bacterium]|jgi:phosphohistidine phosphatase|nr:phosphohistidine phosphatase SixA [Cyanobacteria bacterium GSL.Bin1]
MSKTVYLIRHGIAVDRAPSQPDETRALTAEGQKKTKKVAQQMQAVGVTFDLILTSPLVRAMQTAEILRDVGLTQTLETFPPLAPGGNIKDWVQWWQHWQTEGSHHSGTLALVGHQPDLGNWAESLVWGKTQQKLVVKKAGVIGLNCPDDQSPLGQSELFLLTSPKWLLK